MSQKSAKKLPSYTTHQLHVTLGLWRLRRESVDLVTYISKVEKYCSNLQKRRFWSGNHISSPRDSQQTMRLQRQWDLFQTSKAVLTIWNIYISLKTSQRTQLGAVHGFWNCQYKRTAGTTLTLHVSVVAISIHSDRWCTIIVWFDFCLRAYQRHFRLLGNFSDCIRHGLTF